MGIILIVILVLLLVGTLPTWGHSKNWGSGPRQANHGDKDNTTIVT